MKNASRSNNGCGEAIAQMLSNNNKIEIDAGTVTLRQPLGHERRPGYCNGCTAGNVDFCMIRHGESSRICFFEAPRPEVARTILSSVPEQPIWRTHY